MDDLLPHDPATAGGFHISLIVRFRVSPFPLLRGISRLGPINENPMDIVVRHTTRYRYVGAVTLERHRLMLRPRDSFDLRILRTGLIVHPAAQLSWTHDMYGNSITWASFLEPAQELLVDSELVLRRYDPASPVPAPAPWRTGAPIAYSEQEQFVLHPFIAPATSDDHLTVTDFAEETVRALTQETGHPLFALSTGIHRRLQYQMRFEEGTQEPAATLSLGTGSCRDYAWLFIECARRLGYAARFVTGYLHNLGGAGAPLIASVGYSHAWAEVYVPGDGWIEFDPTNLLVADRQLIRIAVTRTPAEASPVLGSFIGAPQAAAPDVVVSITQAEFPED